MTDIQKKMIEQALEALTQTGPNSNNCELADSNSYACAKLEDVLATEQTPRQLIANVEFKFGSEWI